MNYQLLTSVLTGQAVEEIATNAPLWDAFTLRQTLKGSAHVDTKCVPLRGNLSFPLAVKAPRTLTPWASQLPECVALVNHILSGLNVKEVGNVLLVSLRPGGRIIPHADEGDYADYFERIHIVVSAATGNWFRCGGTTHEPSTGDVFQFNHRLIHSAGNDSDQERIHLIVDVKLKE